MKRAALLLMTTLLLSVAATSTFAMNDLNNEPICRDARFDARCF
jgi:hypothetical protein